MNVLERLEASDWRLGHDFFRFESRNFERDVEVIVLGSLEAGTKYMKRQLKREEGKFEKAIDKAGPDSRDWYSESYGEFVSEVSDQMRFLRNMALVALMDRLVHTLVKLAKQGEYFSPRTKSIYEGEDDFRRLWREYDERFNIQFSAKHIQWIKPLHKARNLIVHNSGAALKERNDETFISKYRYLVEGQGQSAEVNISDEHLRKAVDNAIELAFWTADQLRKRQVQFETTKLEREVKKAPNSHSKKNL